MSAWANSLDRMVKRLRSRFGVPVVYHASPLRGGTSYSGEGIFDETHERVVFDQESGVQVTESVPMLSLIPAAWAIRFYPRDTVEVSDRTWEVTSVEPDGSGMYRLLLVQIGGEG